MLIRTLKHLLTLPAVRTRDLDHPDTLLLHSRIAKEKAFLRQVYINWYRSIVKMLPPDVEGAVVEVGSGGGFLNEFIPGLITSEVQPVPVVDAVFDAHRPPFGRGSLKAIILIDVFHHLSRPDLFLNRAADCVKPGGMIFMIEPWKTAWSQFVYRYLHHEPFDPQVTEWGLTRGGPLSQANSALPWIVFGRDLEKFKYNFPVWEIRKIRLHSPFCYLLSGGLSFRSLMPGRCYKMLRIMEDKLTPWMHSLAMFADIVLTRTSRKMPKMH